MSKDYLETVVKIKVSPSIDKIVAKKTLDTIVDNMAKRRTPNSVSSGLTPKLNAYERHHPPKMSRDPAMKGLSTAFWKSSLLREGTPSLRSGITYVSKVTNKQPPFTYYIDVVKKDNQDIPHVLRYRGTVMNLAPRRLTKHVGTYVAKNLPNVNALDQYDIGGKHLANIIRSRPTRMLRMNIGNRNVFKRSFRLCGSPDYEANIREIIDETLMDGFATGIVGVKTNVKRK